MKEGNILSFKIMIDSKGTLVTELSQLPEEAVSNPEVPEEPSPKVTETYPACALGNIILATLLVHFSKNRYYYF